MYIGTPPKSSQVRALVDCDSFYAGCEIARNPSLIGKPVCVCRYKDIVLAASYEAKALGIKTGTASWDAKKILGNNGVFIEPDMQYYVKVSEQIMEILKEECNDIDVYSIDEAFIEISSALYKSQEDYQKYGEYIRDRIRNELRVSVSLGIAPTRLLAKMFSGMKKPKGVTCIFDINEIHKKIGNLPITEIPFINYRTASRFGYGEKKIIEFLQYDYQYIQNLMGVIGVRLKRELYGINAIDLRKPEKSKSIGRSKSFHPNFTSDRRILRGHIVQNFENAYSDLMRQGGAISVIAVSFRTKDFKKYGALRKLPSYTNNKKEIGNIIKELFIQLYNKNKIYRTTGISFSNITYSLQGKSLFDNQSEKESDLQKVIEALNQKFGKKVLTSASNQKALHVNKKDTQFILGDLG